MNGFKITPPENCVQPHPSSSSGYVNGGGGASNGQSSPTPGPSQNMMMEISSLQHKQRDRVNDSINHVINDALLSSELQNLQLQGQDEPRGCDPLPSEEASGCDPSPSDEASMVHDRGGEIEGSEKMVFSPPVYVQRYSAVNEVLSQILKLPENKDPLNGRTIMEVGCAEFGLHCFLKSILDLGKIIYLDIDERLLMEKKFRLRPFPGEFLQPPSRPKPLVAEVYAGDISRVDERLLQESPRIWGVIAIELIEHLVPSVLFFFEKNVFGVINPEVVIVTTPNADFNVLFNLEPGKFRHWDHKFEWTRAEFEAWCRGICAEFTCYVYSIHGIAEGPPETAHLGCVSQMAVFTKIGTNPPMQFPTGRGLTGAVGHDCYKMLDSLTFPNYIEKRSPEEIIINDLDYMMSVHWLSKSRIEEYMENGEDIVEFSIGRIRENIPTKSEILNKISDDQLKDILIKSCKYNVVPISPTEYGVRVVVSAYEEEQYARPDSEEEMMMLDSPTPEPEGSIFFPESDESWE